MQVWLIFFLLRKRITFWYVQPLLSFFKIIISGPSHNAFVVYCGLAILTFSALFPAVLIYPRRYLLNSKEISSIRKLASLTHSILKVDIYFILIYFFITKKLIRERHSFEIKRKLNFSIITHFLIQRILQLVLKRQ